MRKLSKKQKLIGFVAILIVAIILTIVITANIISKNNQITSEDYLATTANANSNLVASYIKEGITIGGITGTLETLDTSDANATPEDIIWGETAYVKGEKITGTKVVTVAHGKASQKTFEENTVLIDDYGNRVKVPVGFKIAEDSATSVTGGVVIEDVTAGDNNTKGSQFVWVPVVDVLTDNNGSKTTITLGRYTFGSNGKETLVQSAENWRDTSNGVIINSYHRELSSSSYGNTTSKNLESFVSNTMLSGGYYIGRYEAGDVLATEERKGTDWVSNASNPITCKKGVYPYNYINQSDASQLCKNMYQSSNFESDLMNSYAWDTAIVFIQTFSGDTNYSIQVGRNTEDIIKKCGESILAKVDSKDETIDVRCNIYDMAGNTYEWTTESSSYTSYPCTLRGGRYNNADDFTAYRVFEPTSYSYKGIATRLILYL